MGNDGHISRMMHQELEDYVDDIVVKSRRREEHFHVMRKVFERCRTFKLRMNPLKCALECPLGNSWASWFTAGG